MGFQLLGQAGHSKGAGPGGLQAVASSEVGALQAPETEEEKMGGRLGRVCHVGHPHAVVLGNTSLRVWGGSTRSPLSPNKPVT